MTNFHSIISNYGEVILPRSFSLYKFGNQTSALREITTSIVQGSAIGPASYVVTSCDLTTTTAGNRVCKYADDTCVIIPVCNSHSRLAELDHIDT